MKTRIVNARREPEYDVYIGRPSIWGNPFIVGVDGTREEVIEMYKNWLLASPDLLRNLYLLKGKVLGCWCSPLACHGDVLVEMADELE